MCWRHVDIEVGRLSIVASLEETAAGVRLKPPKSGRSRTVALPALAVEELQRHRLKQAGELLALGVRQSEDTNVCLQKNYERWLPSNLTSAFYNSYGERDFRESVCRDLRHSHATHLLAANVPSKDIVQERLGHANIATTIDLYSHVMPGMQEDAAIRVDAALRAAIGKREKSKR